MELAADNQIVPIHAFVKRVTKKPLGQLTDIERMVLVNALAAEHQQKEEVRFGSGCKRKPARGGLIDWT
jgi:hypothetical protein